jgi:SAM-dependent methyltransferase
MCPRYQSLEKHRMSCAFFGTIPSLLVQPDDSPFRLLHFGPHSRMDKVISSLHQVDHIRIDYFAEGYTSSTYNRDTYFGDITKLTLFDNFADGAIVLHILEHLVELAPALNELYRVLKRNAWLLVEVPCMRRDHTGSKPCLGNMTKEERHQCSGQFDHFWSYDCVDFEKQVINHGFSCQKAKDMISDMLTPEAVTKFRLGSGRMFLCRKL